MITLLIVETSTIVLICVIISAQLSSPPIGRLNFLVGWHPKVLTGTSLSANSLEKMMIGIMAATTTLLMKTLMANNNIFNLF